MLLSVYYAKKILWVNVRGFKFIFNDKLKLFCQRRFICCFSTTFPALSVLRLLLQGLMLRLISIVCFFLFCFKSKFFQFFYMHLICKIVKFTWILSLRRFSELRTIVRVEGSILVTYLGVCSF